MPLLNVLENLFQNSTISTLYSYLILNIIRDFLSSRSLRTSVRGCYSASRDVLSGVPQGSVLGPLLFVLFVNYLPDELKNATKLFADDLKLIVNASNKLKTNEDLSKLEKWESLWLIKFNPSKCKVMHLAYNNNPIHNISWMVFY